MDDIFKFRFSFMPEYRYYLKFPQKYFDNIDCGVKFIDCQTATEYKTAKELDNSPDIMCWGYKVYTIPYYSKLYSKTMDFQPHFYTSTIDQETKQLREYLFEVDAPNILTNGILIEDLNEFDENEMILVNAEFALSTDYYEKFRVVNKWCRERNMNFEILNKEDVFLTFDIVDDKKIN